MKIFGDLLNTIAVGVVVLLFIFLIIFAFIPGQPGDALDRIYNLLTQTYAALLGAILAMFFTFPKIRNDKSIGEPPKPSPPLKVPGWLLRVLRISGLLLLALAIITFIVLVRGKQLVPDTINKTLPEAIELVKEAKLFPVVKKEFSNQPSNIVIASQPLPGNQKKINSSVVLIVSRGKPRVPNVIGMKRNQAAQRLVRYNLLLTIRETAYSNKAKGTIVAQWPSAGTKVNVDSEVSVHISKGKPSIPNVIGKLKDEAIRLLQERTLKPKVVEQFSDEQEALVLKVTPPPGTRVSINSTVVLTVSHRGIHVPVTSYFYSSGWMGDGMYGTKYIQLDTGDRQNPYSGPTAIKVTYTPGPKKWAGIYWQYPPNNWGDRPGRTDLTSAVSVVFWARGEKGGEVVKFKAGGLKDDPNKKHQDSFEKYLGEITLSNQWKRYEIDLHGLDLSNIVGGFAWIAEAGSNPQGLTFYLDDIYYE